MKKSGQFYLIGLLIIVVGIMWGTYQQAIDITTFSQFKPEKKASLHKPVRYFGVVSRYTPREIFQGYQPIMDYLTKNTSYQFELKLSSSYEGTAIQLARGDISVAAFGSFLYVTHKDDYDLEVILQPLNKDGESINHLMFIAHESKSIQSIRDLEGLSIVLPSKESLTGQWMPLYIEQTTGIKFNDFNSIEYVSHHTTVAELVLSGEFDVGVVKEPVAEMAIQKGLKIIHSVPVSATSPLVISANTDSITKDEIIDAFLSLKIQSNENKDFLKNWDEEFSYGFKRSTDADYDPIRKILKSINNIP
ncbi:MAG: PhnD/SsuA/transferrin family substrate-binding protein [Candidatus Marinimicrobia bacterium]|nr:PhnD/SsuA/transferrin family substrate-binding protein [Candidatus Neomarinimicrobiota bacterium]